MGELVSIQLTTPRPAALDRPASGASSGRRRPAQLLSRRLRKSVLALHLVSAGAWIGIDVIAGVLALTGLLADDAATRGLAYQFLGTFLVAPMLAAGLMCLTTGLLLGLGTKWGLVRYWWVTVKLVLNLVLCTLIVVLLRPGMAEVREHGQALSTGTPTTGTMAALLFPPAVSLTALTIATVLSVFKPGGRIRKATTSPR